VRWLASAMTVLALGGCSATGLLPSAPKPWVKPYERQNLADEIMGSDRYPLDDAFLAHMRESREGARGAGGAGGGGCGCN
jgi:hypothetical protein